MNAVGLVPRRLPFTSSNSAIRTFRHAISLDEHRAKFKPNFYNRLTEEEAKRGTKKGQMPKPGEDFSAQRRDKADAKLETHKNRKGSHHSHKSLPQHEAKFDADTQSTNETDVLEVWFAGCHTGMSSEDISYHCSYSSFLY